jgi:transposase
MGQTVCVLLSAADRKRLEAIASDRNQPRKYVERARVVLVSANRRAVQQVAIAAKVSRPMVWRWQQRFAEEGPDGLLRDKTRQPGKPPIAAETVARIVALTCGDPPAGTTHWTGRAMAKAAGVSLRSVQRIWKAHQLQPHRVRTCMGGFPSRPKMLRLPFLSSYRQVSWNGLRGARQLARSIAPHTCIR